MRSLSKKYLDDIILDLSKKYGVDQVALKSMINSVFRLFLSKMTAMNNDEVINMRHLGRFYMGQVAIKNKTRWRYITELLEKKLKEENIYYECE